MSRLVLLMRHAQAVDFAPGRADRDRPLTPEGHAQARAGADFLAGRGVRVDHALVSSATRTRETAADLGLACPVEHLDRLYNASESTIREVLAEAPDDASTLLVVAHNPGIHAAVAELGDLGGHPDGSRLAYAFPSSTIVGLEVQGQGWDVGPGAPLAFVRFGA